MPKNAKDPANPQRSRHVARIAKDLDHIDNRANAALVENDTALALQWLGATPGNSLSTQVWRDFADALKWTPGYRVAIANRIRDALIERTKETVEQTRARLVHGAEEIRRLAIDTLDLGPALGALRLQADILLPAKEDQKPQILQQFVIVAPQVAKDASDWAKKVIGKPRAS